MVQTNAYFLLSYLMLPFSTSYTISNLVFCLLCVYHSFLFIISSHSTSQSSTLQFLSSSSDYSHHRCPNPVGCGNFIKRQGSLSVLSLFYLNHSSFLNISVNYPISSLPSTTSSSFPSARFFALPTLPPLLPPHP